MKKRLAMMVFLLGICVLCMAQMKKELQTEKNGYKWYEIKIGDKVGAMDLNGNVIVPCDYRQVWVNAESFLVTKISNQGNTVYMGAYNIKGQNVIPVSRHYTTVCRQDDEDGSYLFFLKNGGCGICDINGRELVFFENTDLCMPDYDDGIFSYLLVKNNLWGIADGNGRIVIAPQYEDITKIYKALDQIKTTRNPLIVSENTSNYVAGNSTSSTSNSNMQVRYYNNPPEVDNLYYKNGSGHIRKLRIYKKKQGNTAMDNFINNIFVSTWGKDCGYGVALTPPSTNGCSMGVTLNVYDNYFEFFEKRNKNYCIRVAKDLSWVSEYYPLSKKEIIYDGRATKEEYDEYVVLVNKFNSTYSNGQYNNYQNYQNATTPNSNSSHGSRCSACNGTGKCTMCNGDGYYWTQAGGFVGEDIRVKNTCNACSGSGSCRVCHGKGVIR